MCRVTTHFVSSDCRNTAIVILNIVLSGSDQLRTSRHSYIQLKATCLEGLHHVGCCYHMPPVTVVGHPTVCGQDMNGSFTSMHLHCPTTPYVCEPLQVQIAVTCGVWCCRVRTCTCHCSVVKAALHALTCY